MPEAFQWEQNTNPQAPAGRAGRVPDLGSWGSQVEEPPGTFVVRYANWGWRFLGGLIDYVLPGVLLDPLGKIGSTLWLVWLVYNSIWQQGAAGQSWGKKLLGMRVCYLQTTDQRENWSYYEFPGRARIAWRLLAHIFDFPFLWGFTIRPIFNPWGRTYADSCAKTVVIRDNRVRVWTREEAEADRNRGYITQ